ncbi:MAG TPA: outer membrane lipoprotein-sorting protein [Gammaproteobacteria bacterium]|nr:outer membrane lipoprotein-sorting protein [Gammaproteobacteria bacterium]
MKAWKPLSLLVFAICLNLLPSPPLQAAPSGLEIMRAVDGREDGDDLRQAMTQTLIDRNGNRRVRHMISFRKDYGKDKRLISFFTEPANIRDTALLTFDYDDPDRDDDQWLYLPALKKVRRISAADRGDYFMGTDFTFEDMKQTPELGDYHWKLLGSEIIDGQECWKVEGVPVSQDVVRELGYSRMIQHVRKDNDFTIRVDYWDRAGRELKHLRVLELRRIQGIWSAVRIEMENVQTKHRTLIELADQHYNTGLKDSLFTKRALKRGYR